MFSWHKVPFARVLIPYTIGICICYWFDAGTAPAIILFSITCFLSLFARYIFSATAHYRVRLFQGLFISIVFLCLGYIRSLAFDDTKTPGHFFSIKHGTSYSITVDDAVVEKKKFYRCYARVTAVSDTAGNIHPSYGFVLVYFNKKHITSKPEVGQTYYMKAGASVISGPANPEEFNYSRYLAFRNIRHQLFSDSQCIIKSSSTEHSIYSEALRFRDHCLSVISRHILSPGEKGVAEALLLGYKDDLDPAITQAFSRTGTLHVLAVSGMHAGLIFLLIGFLTRPLEKKKHGKWIQFTLLLTGIWFYAFMTGLSSSVLRATVMFSIMSLGKTLHYKANIYNTLFASAFILLLYNPFYIFDVGFQLSYLAVLGIIWLQPKLGRLYAPPNRPVKYAWELLTVSLAAQVLTFPVSLFYFHQFPNYFLISNMLIIPLTSFILFGLIILLALSWITPAAVLAGKGLLYAIRFNNYLVTEIDSLPYALSEGFYIDVVQVTLLYAAVICLITFFSSGKKWILFLMLTCVFSFSALTASACHKAARQKIFVIHSIKGHDVFSCIEGRKAYILADSGFFNDSSMFAYHISPYLLSKGVSETKKLNMEKSFVSTNIRIKKGIGFQFFDNIMTIQHSCIKNTRKRCFMLIKTIDSQNTGMVQCNKNQVIISNAINKSALKNLNKEYFKLYGKPLKLNKKATVFILH